MTVVIEEGVTQNQTMHRRNPISVFGLDFRYGDRQHATFSERTPWKFLVDVMSKEFQGEIQVAQKSAVTPHVP